MNSSVLLLFAHRLIGYVSTKILHKLNVFMSATIYYWASQNSGNFFTYFFVSLCRRHLSWIGRREIEKRS